MATGGLGAELPVGERAGPDEVMELAGEGLGLQDGKVNGGGHVIIVGVNSLRLSITVTLGWTKLSTLHGKGGEDVNVICT